MLIYRKFMTGVLRAPDEGDGAGGGDADNGSHESDADATFGGDSSTVAGGDAGGDNTDAAAAKAAADAAAAKAAADKTAADQKTKPQSIFDKVAPAKPDADKAAADAAAKAAATKAAAGEAPEDKINLGEKANASTKEQFNQLKQMIKAERESARKAASEIAELKKRTGATDTSPEVERIRAEHKKFSDELAIVNLERHPKFVAQFVEPKNKLLTGASAVLSDNQIAGVDLASLVGKPRVEFSKAVSEIAAKLPAFEQAAFINDMRQVYQLDADGKAQLGNAAELRKNLSAQNSERARTAFDQTYKELDFAGASALKPFDIPADATAEERASLEAFNNGITGMRTAAENYAFGALDEKQTAVAATKAAAFDFMRTHAVPRMAAEFEKGKALIAELTAELKALKGNRRQDPGGGGGGGGGENDAEDSHEAAASRIFK